MTAGPAYHTTVIIGEHPMLTALIEQRRALGQDGSDEVWDGVYYVVPHADLRHGLIQGELVFHLKILAKPLGLSVTPEFNLGDATDYRIPDLGVHRGIPVGLYAPTAAMVVEVLSPDDKTFEKFDFYAAHGVDEILVVDPVAHSTRIWIHDSATADYQEAEDSVLLQTSCADVTAAITWP